jgi:PAS domain S-box-containing protein
MPDRPLPLILARELAANVATPYLVIDAQGTLVFFNERAERILGVTPSELGEMPEEEWRTRFQVERPDGTPVESEETPSARARRERRLVQDTLVYTWADGRRTTLSVTATPLLGREEELVGVFLLFWELDKE